MNMPTIDLSRNEFWFNHPVVQKAMPHLTAEEICKYQMQPQFVKALANHHGVDSDYITPFNGAEHALRSIFGAASRLKGTKLLLPRQGWDYYWKLADGYHVKAEAYDYKENGQTFELDSEGLKQKIREAERPVLLLDSPSNPLACRIDDSTLHELATLTATKGYTLFDNTYANFCDEGEAEASLPENLAAMPKTVVVRSLSKYYGIPGLRVGFAAAQPETLKDLSIQKDYLGFNAFSDAFATRCLHMHKEFQAVTKQLVGNRKRLTSLYNSIPGFKPFSSSANFMLVRVPDADYAPFLLEQGVKIKPFSDEELKGCVRITIPPLPTVERIEKATHSFCRHKGIHLG